MQNISNVFKQILIAVYIYIRFNAFIRIIFVFKCSMHYYKDWTWQYVHKQTSIYNQ